MATMITRSLWSKAKGVPVAYPFTFGVVLSGFKTSLSDLLVQKVRENCFLFKRCTIFCLSVDNNHVLKGRRATY
jgi:hypothetical protein